MGSLLAQDGYLPYRNINLKTTGQVVKASPGKLGGWFIANKDAAAFMYVKFYDKATAPTEADTPVMTVPIPYGAGSNPSWFGSVRFRYGISVRATTGIADNDTGAPDDNDVVVNLLYV